MLWFDAEHSHAAAGVFLLTPDGRVVLQLRDDIPGIDNPGRITTFGGAARPGESPIACARRELAEETGLRPAGEKLLYLDAVSRTDFRGHRIACVFYTLRGVEPATLAVTEGAAIVLTRRQIETDPRLTVTCRAMAARMTAVRN
jgi:8-oxo-dGTP pyrophosphatase MutT (NUDIX family)